MSTHRRDDEKSSWVSWALIIFLFVVGAWPAALPLLFIKLFAPDRLQRKNKSPQQSNQYQSEGRTQETRARTAAKNVVRSPREKNSNSFLLKLIGAALIFVGLVSINARTGVWEMLTYLALASGGAGMFFSGFIMDRAMKRYPRYLAVMGDEGAVPFTEISRKLGYSEKRVIRDLQKMIDQGYFGRHAYLNMEFGYIIRSEQADAEFEQKRKAASAPPPKEAEEGYSGILRNIRRVNDEIADPVLSQKIDRLEELTAKIFQAVEEDPKKRGQIDTFMNYYLPTTQKLLDSYAKFESAGIESENLKAAKERIEKTMDSIIAGFAHQLDELYAADTMDVDSDIRVMETMLNRDTASVEKDFGLGKDGAENSGKSASQENAKLDLGGAEAQFQDKDE